MMRLGKKEPPAKYKKQLEQLWTDVHEKKIHHIDNNRFVAVSYKQLYHTLFELPYFCSDVCLLYYLGKYSLAAIATLYNQPEHMIQHYLTTGLHVTKLILCYQE